MKHHEKTHNWHYAIQTQESAVQCGPQKFRPSQGMFKSLNISMGMALIEQKSRRNPSTGSHYHNDAMNPQSNVRPKNSAGFMHPHTIP